jgi:hypothetical protein
MLKQVANIVTSVLWSLKILQLQRIMQSKKYGTDLVACMKIDSLQLIFIWKNIINLLYIKESRMEWLVTWDQSESNKGG